MEHFSHTDLTTIKHWLGTGSINIFGLPFSGKDTHAKLLAKQLDASIMGGGEILRNSVIPPHVKELLDAGSLVPVDDFIRIVLPYLSRPEFAGRPLILSTVGRSHGEEAGVMGATQAAGHPIKAVVYLVLSEEISRRRFAESVDTKERGWRADDAEHKLATRYAAFYEKTLPVLEFYREKGLLIEIDGVPSIEDVQQAILGQLLAKAEAESAS